MLTVQREYSILYTINQMGGHMKNIILKNLFPESEQFQNKELYDKVEKIWNRLLQESNWGSIDDLPVSSNMPNYSHIVHNRCVLKMALAVADTIAEVHGVEVNRDYLLAAGMLQDASKLIEYEPSDEKILVKTTRGKLYPHSFYVATLAKEEGLPEEIVSAILTHSPNSADVPKTLEGKILFHVDQIDMAAIGGDRWIKKVMLYR